MPYVPEASSGVRWDDPAFGIEWPAASERTIGERDRTWPDTCGSAKRAAHCSSAAVGRCRTTPRCAEALLEGRRCTPSENLLGARGVCGENLLRRSIGSPPKCALGAPVQCEARGRPRRWCAARPSRCRSPRLPSRRSGGHLEGRDDVVDIHPVDRPSSAPERRGLAREKPPGDIGDELRRVRWPGP